MPASTPRTRRRLGDGLENGRTHTARPGDDQHTTHGPTPPNTPRRRRTGHTSDSYPAVLELEPTGEQFRSDTVPYPAPHVCQLPPGAR